MYNNLSFKITSIAFVIVVFTSIINNSFFVPKTSFISVKYSQFSPTFEDKKFPIFTQATPPEKNLVENLPPLNVSNTPVRLSDREIWLSCAVLLFGVLVLMLEFILVKSSKEIVKLQDLLMLFTVTLIIVGTLFLISSGISSNQIAPALGLYGTIVGYLLGRQDERQIGVQNNKQDNINKERNHEKEN